MNKAYSTLLFLLILLSVSIFYNYHEIVFKRPQSVHKWRQSDCASIALNYYQNGMDFFTPETHNLTSDNGTSGRCCPSEIPVLYYTVAFLYKIFGYNDSIFRIFNTLIFFLGLLYLFRVLLYLLKDAFWAISLTILFFTSPVLVYYGNNFLSNTSAFAFSIVGWYYFFRFSTEHKTKWVYTSIIVFLFAAAFKVTALISLFAIAGLFIIELLGITKFDKNRKLFDSPIWIASTIILVLVIIGGWISYASIYNQKHDCTYFSTTIFPIWDLNSYEIRRVLDNIENIWLEQYFHKSVFFFLTLCFVFFLVKIKKNKKLLNFSILILSFQIVFYILLQFWTFADHDYYTINIYILPILIVISVFDTLKRQFKKLFNSILLKIAFSIFLLFNIYYTNQKIYQRYHGWMNDYDKTADIYTITPYLRQLGINQNDTVISIPDGSHASLYLMNQKGWTEYTDTRFNRGEKIYYNRDSSGIISSINKGARYLIINGIEEIYKKPYLESFCNNLIGHYNNVLIFDLTDSTDNFSLKNRIPEKIIHCNAELLSKDSLYFISASDSSLFEFGKTQSDDFAHSGTYSSKLSANDPYGMTIRLDNLVIGESFLISVWRKTSNKSDAGLVVSSSAVQYYNNNFNVTDENQDGWKKITMDFFVSSKLVNQELTIYVYNPDSNPVYFDDLEIIRYESVIPN